jgi:1,4-dihydroxy-2-naphthoyl-CoA hydrolase
MAFEHTLRVRFQHTDPAGIVFFSNILVYCHEAYEELLRTSGMPLEEFLGKRGQVLPLGHAEATFKRPFRAGQLVRIRVIVGRLGERSFRLEYDLFDEAGKHLATAATVHVSVDPATGQSTAIDAQLRQLLQQHAVPGAEVA